MRLNVTHTMNNLIKNIYVPNIPIISKKSGWLLRYLRGPYDHEYFEMLRGDIIAGLTVGVIIVPQGLAYAQLAGLPPIVGLYSSILPLFAYSILGTSMLLSVGPVTIISLMTSQILAKYSTNLDVTNSEDLIDIAAQASFCTGILLVSMSLLNMGKLFSFISHPVLSGFTTGVAFISGLAQLGQAAGFQCGSSFRQVPKLGQKGYEYNYKVMSWLMKTWHQPLSKADIYSQVKSSSDYEVQSQKEYMIGWSRFNPYALKIFCGVYIPLVVLQVVMDKLKIAKSLRIKNSQWYRILLVLHPIVALIATSLAGKAAMDWMRDPKLSQGLLDETYLEYMQHNINVVGHLSSDLNFIRLPKFKCEMGYLFIDVLPISIILFLESFACGKKVASQLSQLDFYSTSQELFAIGVSNLLNSFSGFPVAGSFSRTSLSASVGGFTPLSSILCAAVVISATGSLSSKFYYIPEAALAATIFVAIYGLISFSDFWEAWKVNKIDFFIMFSTFLCTFALNSGLGLGIGIGLSIVCTIYETILSNNAPQVSTVTSGRTEVVKLKAYHMTFMTCESLKRVLSEKIVTNSLQVKAVKIDLSKVTVMDLTGARALIEVAHEYRQKGLLLSINARENVYDMLKALNFTCDEIKINDISNSLSDCDVDSTTSSSSEEDTTPTADLSRESSSATDLRPFHKVNISPPVISISPRLNRKVYIDDVDEKQSTLHNRVSTDEFEYKSDC